MADLKPLYILDASTIIKWVFDENNTKEALKIKNDMVSNKIKIGIPSHCYSEIMNTLGIKTPAIAVTFLSNLLAKQITEFPLTIEIASQALNIMQKHSKISFYDATYHATAIENKGTFITADEKYFNETKSFKKIKLLKNY